MDMKLISATYSRLVSRPLLTPLSSEMEGRAWLVTKKSSEIFIIQRKRRSSRSDVKIANTINTILDFVYGRKHRFLYIVQGSK